MFLCQIMLVNANHTLCNLDQMEYWEVPQHNIFFAKSNISEVNFVKLFSLVCCFLRENYVRSQIFPSFPTSSLWAQKLNQQPAVMYDMGKRDFVIKRNKVNTSGAQQYSIMASRGHKRMLFYGAFSHIFPISYIISCKNDR